MTRRDAGLEGPEATRLRDAIEKQDLIFKDSFPGALGVRILEAAPGRAVGRVEVGPAVRHPGGYAHGGAIAGFGDTVAAWATFPSLEPGESFTTIEFKVNFVAGVQAGSLRAEATAVHRGRRTMVLEVRISAEAAGGASAGAVEETGDAIGERVQAEGGSGDLVALMVVTQAILRPAGAEKPGGSSPASP